MKIPNIRELASAIEGAAGSKSHGKLLKAIQACYPAAEFRLVSTSRIVYLDGGIVSADGKVKIADCRQSWLTAAFEQSGRDANRVREKYRDRGYLSTEYQSEQVWIAMPYASEADAFFEIEVSATREIATRPLIETNGASSGTLKGLLDPWISPLKNPVEVTPWRYELGNVTDIRRFLSKVTEIEHKNRVALIPELRKRVVEVVCYGDGHTFKEQKPYLEMLPAGWLNAPRVESRLVNDWNASSAGKHGHRFCDHWVLETYDHREGDGKGSIGCMPRLSAKATKIPEIASSRCRTYSNLVEKIEKFDKTAGYPMAWYFHMLYGCKVCSGVGTRVVNGIEEGKINLPANDVDVVLRWHESPYGF
jgi:hypothetical protein